MPLRHLLERNLKVTKAKVEQAAKVDEEDTAVVAVGTEKLAKKPPVALARTKDPVASQSREEQAAEAAEVALALVLPRGVGVEVAELA